METPGVWPTYITQTYKYLEVHWSVCYRTKHQGTEVSSIVLSCTICKIHLSFIETTSHEPAFVKFLCWVGWCAWARGSIKITGWRLIPSWNKCEHILLLCKSSVNYVRLAVTTDLHLVDWRLWPNSHYQGLHQAEGDSHKSYIKNCHFLQFHLGFPAGSLESCLQGGIGLLWLFLSFAVVSYFNIIKDSQPFQGEDLKEKKCFSTGGKTMLSN